MSVATATESALHDFVRRHAPGAEPLFTPVFAGRNNQGWKVVAGPHVFFLKRYFVSPTRDRLASEWQFLSYAIGCGVRNVPRPLARDETARAILFEFVAGDRFDGRTVTEADARAALTFTSQLNPADRATRGAGLPPASDSCFSLADHAAHVVRRIDALKADLTADAVGQRARVFVNETLEPAARSTVELLRKQARAAARDWHTPVPRQRCAVSPSDFGFHNALRVADGAIVFLDFEYAGWDDPLKVVCDYFTQPDCPVPLSFLEHFCAEFAPLREANHDLAWIRAWLPLYAVKWTCIMLNPLLSSHRERVAFASRDETPALILDRAIGYFERHPSRHITSR